jgi:aspartyl-tRNA(Asn)/glutamyl-tRNA(Gln) amidotransferase subunit A
MNLQPALPHAPTVRELTTAYARGEQDPVQVTERALMRAEAGDPALFTALCPDRARREAAASAARWRAGAPLGPLDGVPTVWKDLFDLRGMVTTAASDWLRNAAPAAQDAATVGALARAGVVSLGKVNLSEFAFSGLGLNPHFGTPLHPLAGDTPRAPGGSSSGSASAVCAGLVPFAMGTDTGGSLRIPAAFQGLVGYQPSAGRHDKTGIYPLSHTLDVPGPMGREVMDCIWVDQAMRGLQAHDLVPLPLQQIDVVVPDNLVWDDAALGTHIGLSAAIARLQNAGVRVSWQSMPTLDAARRSQAECGSLVAAEAYAWHRERVDGPQPERFDPRVLQRLLRGKAMSAAQLVDLMQRRQALQAELRETLGHRLLLWPTVVHEAPELAPLKNDDLWFDQMNQRTLRNTMLANFLGLCGMSLPAAHGDAGLPLALSLHAPGQHDETLLRAALTLAPLLAVAGR